MEEIKDYERRRALAKLFEMHDADFPPGLELETAVDLAIVLGEVHEMHCPPMNFMDRLVHDLSREAVDNAVRDLITATNKRYKEFKQSHRIR